MFNSAAPITPKIWEYSKYLLMWLKLRFNDWKDEELRIIAAVEEKVSKKKKKLEKLKFKNDLKLKVAEAENIINAKIEKAKQDADAQIEKVGVAIANAEFQEQSLINTTALAQS